MKKILAFMIVFLLLISLMFACDRGSAETAQVYFIKRAYSFDEASGSINLVFCSNSHLRGWNIDNIKSCVLVSDSTGSELACVIEKINLAEYAMYTIKDVDYYQNSMTIRFDKLKATLGDVSLTLNFNDGETASYDIGSISFTDINEVDSLAITSQYIEYAYINPALFVAEDGILQIPAVAICIAVLDDITIQSLKFGFSELGFAARGVQVFTEAEYDSHVSQKLEDMQLHEIIEDIYVPQYTDKVDEQCQVDLSAGIYYLIVPIEMTKEAYKPIRAGATILFSTGSDQLKYCIPCNPLYKENFFSEAEILSLLQN
jgi:hypothetical protein